MCSVREGNICMIRGSLCKLGVGAPSTVACSGPCMHTHAYTPVCSPVFFFKFLPSCDGHSIVTFFTYKCGTIWFLKRLCAFLIQTQHFRRRAQRFCFKRPSTDLKIKQTKKKKTSRRNKFWNYQRRIFLF